MGAKNWKEMLGVFVVLIVAVSPRAHCGEFSESFYQNPLRTFQAIQAEISMSPNLNACLPSIHQLREALPTIQVTKVDNRLLDFSNPVEEQNPRVWMPQFASSLWSLQKSLRSALQSAHEAGELSTEALSAVRELNRLLRFVRDFTSVYLTYDPQRSLREGEPQFFGGTQDLQGFDFKAGDILLTRSPTATSGIIPRLPVEEHDDHMSHVVFISQSPDGQLIGIESLIETGVRQFSIQELLDRQSPRGVILRHPNSQVAQMASDLMFARVDRGPYMPYDFLGNGPRPGRENYQCVHIPQKAFEWAYEKLGLSPTREQLPYSIPLFVSEIDKLAPIGAQLGLDPQLTQFFAPSDLWFQLDFQLIGEWSYPDQLEDVLLFDATTDRLFDWSREEQLVIKPRFRDRLKASLAIAISFFWDYLPENFQRKVPRDMSYESIKVANALLALVNELKGELLAESDRFISENEGAPMSWADAIKSLEEIRDRLERDPRSLVRLLQSKGSQ